MTFNAREQAESYASFMREKGLTTVRLFEHDGDPDSDASVAQHHLLARLVGRPDFMLRRATYKNSRELVGLAREAGLKVVEYVE